MQSVLFICANFKERRRKQSESHKNLYKKPAYTFTEHQPIFRAVQTAKKSIKMNNLFTMGYSTVTLCNLFAEITNKLKPAKAEDNADNMDYLKEILKRE